MAVLISGRGSNLQALIDACAAAVVSGGDRRSSSPTCRGRRGLPAPRPPAFPRCVVDHQAFAERSRFEDALDAGAAWRAGVELVCLAGFMRLLTDGFVERWRDRLINIHPSLLPAFRGLHVHERVIAAGARFSGCTVHFVRPAMDDGPIIVQAAVPVHADDDADRLAARVLAEEHRIYPLAVRLIAEGPHACRRGAGDRSTASARPRAAIDQSRAGLIATELASVR